MQSQLITFLNAAHLLKPFQSGFTAHHSTLQSALLTVLNDILLAVDAGKNAVLIMLDLIMYCTVRTSSWYQGYGFTVVQFIS